MSDTKGLMMYFFFFSVFIFYFFIFLFFYIIFQCIGTLDWIRSEGHTGVIRYK